VTEERTPQWLHCMDCKCEFILMYLPAPADEFSKACKNAKCPECKGKKLAMGQRPKPVGISGDAHAMDRVLAWLASGDTGISSESLAYEFLNQERPGRSGCHPPLDPADLGRCLRFLALVPEARICVDRLAAKNKGWELAAKAWDAITASMIAEVGIDWSKGKSAPATYAMMKAAGL